MRILSTALFLGLSLLVVSGCGLLGPDDPVEVRVRNGSGLVLDHVVLFLPDQELVFSGMQPGEESPYTEVERAYRSASAEVVVAQDTARLQVIDYVGEKLLDSGRYTYVLRVTGGSPLNLGLEFEKDS